MCLSLVSLVLSPDVGEVSIVVTVLDEEAAQSNGTGPLSRTVLDEIGDTILEELGMSIVVENVERFGE